jgi:hypothetical protein
MKQGWQSADNWGMADPMVYFAIPSASPENCRRVLPVWREMGYKTAILQNYMRGDIPADICVWSDSYPGWPGSINILAKEIVPKQAAIIVSGGDDMLPDPNVPAHKLAQQFLERFPDSFGVMQPTGDGFLGARHFCGSPWLGRAWCDSMYQGSGPMPSGYRHNWADNELYWVAKCLHGLWERPDLSQHHEHFTRTGQDKPSYWTSNVETKDRDDVQLFIARSWQKFPGHEPRGVSRPFDAELFKRENRGLAEAYWMTRYGFGTINSTSGGKIAAAFAVCIQRGWKRVGLFGAGTHTRALGTALMQPPVEIAAIVDDNAALQGQSLWGYPIVSQQQAQGMKLDAVILSSNSMEEELWAAAAPLRNAGIPVLRLYGEVASHKQAA